MKGFQRMTKKIEMHDWIVRGNALLQQSKEILSSAPSENIKVKANRIPESVLDSKSEINIVFTGQYSAGKSTILKVLTGRDDIEIGAGITKQGSNSYNWNGINVIDTPGIHTKLYPDHDDITYRAIADADLLIFVTTNELFDSHLARHFRDLAIEREKAHEMMLVVNKMQRCAKGNSADVQNVIREDLRKVLKPFSPEELRTSFIDAESALNSRNEKDSKYSEILWKRGGVDSFIENLNNFAEKKGLTGQYSTALYTLEQILQETEALESESTGDKDISGLKEVLLQNRRALHETRMSIAHEVKGKIYETCSMIRKEGREISEKINGSANPDSINLEFENSENQSTKLSEQLGQDLQEIIRKQLEGFEIQSERITSSELAKVLLLRLKSRVKEIPMSPASMNKLNDASNISKGLGKFLVRNSFKPNSNSIGEFIKLRPYSSTTSHSTIKIIGKFLGKRFNPWEAVKWTRYAAHFGRILGVVGAVLTIYLQVKEKRDAEKYEAELRESRTAIRGGFNDCAKEIEMHYDQATKSFVDGEITPQIEKVDRQLSELRDIEEEKSNLVNEISILLGKTRNLIHEIHCEVEDKNDQ